MPTELEPPELAQLVDFAERPRVGDWSLRAALVRYAQPEPEQVGQIVELVRRIEWALQAESKLLASEGPAVWATLASGPDGADGPNARTVALLRAATEMDQLGDVLARWAVDAAGSRPTAEVDDVTADVASRLDAINVPREDQDNARRRRA
jgi:hypothetical protein